MHKKFVSVCVLTWLINASSGTYENYLKACISKKECPLCVLICAPVCASAWECVWLSWMSSFDFPRGKCVETSGSAVWIPDLGAVPVGCSECRHSTATQSPLMGSGWDCTWSCSNLCVYACGWMWVCILFTVCVCVCVVFKWRPPSTCVDSNIRLWG